MLPLRLEDPVQVASPVRDEMRQVEQHVEGQQPLARLLDEGDGQLADDLAAGAVAAKRKRDWIRYVAPATSSRILLMMTSGAGRVKDTKLVLNPSVHPLCTTRRVRIGSSSVCGRSTWSHGLAAS